MPGSKLRCFSSNCTTQATHTVAENLVVPCCREIVRIMLGENAAKEIQKIPLSDNTVSRRINDMAADILEQLRDKLLESNFFLYSWISRLI